MNLKNRSPHNLIQTSPNASPLNNCFQSSVRFLSVLKFKNICTLSGVVRGNSLRGRVKFDPINFSCEDLLRRPIFCGLSSYRASIFDESSTLVIGQCSQLKLIKLQQWLLLGGARSTSPFPEQAGISRDQLIQFVRLLKLCRLRLNSMKIQQSTHHIVHWRLSTFL